MAPHLPAAAVGLLLRGMAKPMLGSRLPVPIQRLGVRASLAGLPRVPVSRRAGQLGGIPTLELTPDHARPDAAILYFHGGGYVTGSPRDYLGLTSHLATAARSRLISADYRLAPEHPFPAAHDDAVSAYAALLDAGQDPAALTVAGDSAGGGLALATVLAATGRGLPAPARLLLISPWLDLRPGAPGPDRRDAMLGASGLERWAATYCAAEPREDPRASPLLADLSGLTVPTLLQYDEHETLAGQSVAFLAAARTAGWPVRAEPFSGLWHDFPLFTELPQARAALRQAGAFICEGAG